jgi:hypothetical protein
MKECPNCKSTRIIKDAFAQDMADNNMRFVLNVAVDEKPEALIFKQRIRSATRAEICGDCGSYNYLLRIQRNSGLLINPG